MNDEATMIRAPIASETTICGMSSLEITEEFWSMSRMQWTQDPCDSLCSRYSSTETDECYNNFIDSLTKYNRNHAHKIDGLDNGYETFFKVTLCFIIIFSAAIAVFILTDSSLSAHPFRLYAM